MNNQELLCGLIWVLAIGCLLIVSVLHFAGHYPLW